MKHAHYALCYIYCQHHPFSAENTFERILYCNILKSVTQFVFLALLVHNDGQKLFLLTHISFSTFSVYTICILLILSVPQSTKIFHEELEMQAES